MNRSFSFSLVQRFITTTGFVLVVISGYAQELKCQLSVNANKIAGVDPAVFKTMESSLNQFMNTTSWTTDIFSPEERIECSITIQITGAAAQDVYNTNITVQSSRPVFNSSYNSPMFNYQDKDCILTYIQNQTLDFSPPPIIQTSLLF